MSLTLTDVLTTLALATAARVHAGELPVEQASGDLSIVLGVLALGPREQSDRLRYTDRLSTLALVAVDNLAVDLECHPIDTPEAAARSAQAVQQTRRAAADLGCLILA